MASIIDIIAVEFLYGATSPEQVLTAFIQLLLAVLVLGWIFSIIFKKYSFFGYALKDWPGCGILAGLVFVIIVIVDMIIGIKSLSYGGALIISMIVLSLLYKIYSYFNKHP
jgi:hypothetical protein